MIALEDLTFAYPGQPPIFQGFSWSVEHDEAWAVIGPSGCGKSTLLYLLAGLRQPDSGHVRVNGQALQRPRPQTGLILQDYGLLPWATVADNAALGLRVRRFYGPDGRHAPSGDRIQPAEVEDRVAYWLERLGIAPLRDQFPAQISGGQRQRTAIARTLAMNPDLLLMDEPFSSLDALTREDLERLTVELREETGVTTVVVPGPTTAGVAATTPPRGGDYREPSRRTAGLPPPRQFPRALESGARHAARTGRDGSCRSVSDPSRRGISCWQDWLCWPCGNWSRS